jgi:class 3 adenylate cyclase
MSAPPQNRRIAGSIPDRALPASWYDDTGRLTARTWRVGFSLLVGGYVAFVVGEWGSQPAVRGWLAATLALMIGAYAGGWLALRRHPRHPVSAWIALATLLAWCVASALHDWQARPGTLPIATFLLVVLGAAILIPWGAGFQTALGLTALVTYTLVLAAGGRYPAAWDQGLLSLGGGVIGSSLGAGWIDRYRRRIAVQEAALREQADALDRANRLISRYVPAQVASHIVAGDDSVERLDRRKLTVFFSDVVDFSELADRVEAEEFARVLNEYLSEMTAIADGHGGTIDKFIGDAIVVLFGAPTRVGEREQARAAVRMALAMQERMGFLRARWLREGIEEPFQIRIGVNTGVASVGNFGSHGRMDYTAIGRQVNLAARLQAACEPGKVLVSHSTWALIESEIPCHARGAIQVKGVHHPVRVYEVICGDEGD